MRDQTRPRVGVGFPSTRLSLWMLTSFIWREEREGGRRGRRGKEA